MQKRPYKARCDCSAVPSWAAEFVPPSPVMSPLLQLRLFLATAMSTGSNEADGVFAVAWTQRLLRFYPCRSPRHCIRFHFGDQRVGAATLIWDNTETEWMGPIF